MIATNLDYLFQDQLRNFAHLIEVQPKTKEEFLKTIADTYSLSNLKTDLFYHSCKRSIFETIRLNDNRDTILFNQ